MSSQRDICFADPTSAACRNYNILVLEAANYQALMTSDFINFLEIIAYYSARSQYCIPERASGKIAMPEIFDMIAGSETGAIIGSTLVIPNDNQATNAT